MHREWSLTFLLLIISTYLVTVGICSTLETSTAESATIENILLSLISAMHFPTTCLAQMSTSLFWIVFEEYVVFLGQLLKCSFKTGQSKMTASLRRLEKSPGFTTLVFTGFKYFFNFTFDV